ncbi:ribonuclease HII [Anoxybacter fermentans]|uniref:Ribonuclease HII n=1 Tax=Anoxybacter fermentans TaxID=1323375 RepID=A0A3S9SVP7_9FIRM|nr:ribonuclease HII [Anoxybacter fermentans]AZR72354.1 ribonuclease HII [Anoxybacter fermentans]
MEVKDFSRLTVNQVENLLKNIEPTPELIARLKEDSRIGIHKIAERLERKLAYIKELESKFERMLEYEKAYWEQGFYRIAGVDEVGRGPLAGPVVAAAVILKPEFRLLGLNDSKQLTEEKREEFYEEILNQALAVGIGIVDNRVIDEINILQASFRAMSLALEQLAKKGHEPDFIFVDGRHPIPGLITFQRPIVGGDEESASIAAASIVAKVTRDRIMVEMAKKYPGYGFERNKGYGSREHLEGLRKLGPSPIHRLSFSQVKL